jgi:alkylation response protein AidB-like acyl-CoA dehydrogenase
VNNQRTAVIEDGVEAARSLRTVSEAEAAACEAARTMTPTMVDALWDSGLMHYLLPAEAGGSEPSFAEIIDVWIEMASQDGSVGWVGIANLPSATAAAAYLPDEGFAEVFGGPDHHATVAGQFFPHGRGVVVDGGYRVSGAWNFGSGSGHSEYVAGGFFPEVDGEIQLDLDAVRIAILPAADVSLDDGWHTQGLKGTGSYDYSVDDVFVPESRTFRLFERTPVRGASPMYRMGIMGVTAAGHAAWALGVARSMLDDVAELAKSKVRMSDMETLAHRQSFQRNYAHHLGMWRAAEAGVKEAFSRVERQVAEGAPFTATDRADTRIAANFATEASREIAQWAHLAAGTSAIREGSRLERAFRDIYTGTQHAFISEKVYIDSAQIHLGLIDDSPGV